jgi:hypothetical protein
MDAKELKSIREAYMEVVENQQLDEISQKTATRAFASRATHDFESDGADNNYTKSGKNKADETKRRIEKKHGKGAGQHAERAAHSNIFGRGKEGFTKMPPKPEKTKNEQVDIYDIILSHLLDEGYAETQQAAEAIMVNMSEEWRDSIVEEFISESEKPFPYEKVKRKQVSLRDKGENALDRRMQMGTAVRRAKEAEKTGGSQKDAGKGWYHGR